MNFEKKEESAIYTKNGKTLIINPDKIGAMGFNRVLVKASKKNDEVKLSDGGKLYVDTEYEPEKHATTSGTVVKLPIGLSYDEQPGSSNSLDFDTEMELEEGDKIFFHYLASLKAVEGNDYYEDEEGNTYFGISYDSIFMAQRGDEVIPVNGYIIAEPVYEKSVNTSIELPESKEKEENVNKAKVKYIGKPNKGYRMRDYTDEMEEELEPGDIIHHNCAVPLQHSIHNEIEGRGKIFYRLQRKNIHAVEGKGFLERAKKKIA